MKATQLRMAMEGHITGPMERVARTESMDPEGLRKDMSSCRIIIMLRKGKPPLGIGKGLSTKVNANIGTSAERVDEAGEVQKAKVAEAAGADTISDLSMGGDIDRIRHKVFAATSAPITTVPIYQTVIEGGGFEDMGPDDLLAMVRKHVDEGVSSIVVHAGFTLSTLEALRGARRIMGMVSKGGSFTAVWMLAHKAENPYFEVFDGILDVCARRDMVLSLGNTMRSGCIVDKMDKAQKDEMWRNALLAEMARERGVQVIIEGMGGHVDPHNIPLYVNRYKDITKERPLFVAGPMPTEVAVGRDHIAACVGGALAAGAGADYLCYITPSEHLRLPDIDDVKEGVIACKIAAHIGDTLKYGAATKDRRLAEARSRRDWEGQFAQALDPEKARSMQPDMARRTCTMCGRFCAIALMEKYLKGRRPP